MARFVCATIAAYGANDLLLPHGPRLRFSGNAADKNDMAVARRAVNRSEPLVFLFFLLRHWAFISGHRTAIPIAADRANANGAFGGACIVLLLPSVQRVV